MNTMIIGILRENPQRERRVVLTRVSVQSLVSCGNQVYMEKDTGDASHFSNEENQQVEAKIVHTSDEVYCPSQILLSVYSPTDENYERLLESQTLLFA